MIKVNSIVEFFTNSVLMALLMFEIPKYYFLFQFDTPYEIFPMFHTGIISHAPRIWLILHLTVGILHILCTTMAVWGLYTGKANYPNSNIPLQIPKYLHYAFIGLILCDSQLAGFSAFDLVTIGLVATLCTLYCVGKSSKRLALVYLMVLSLPLLVETLVFFAWCFRESHYYSLFGYMLIEIGACLLSFQ